MRTGLEFAKLALRMSESPHAAGIRGSSAGTVLVLLCAVSVGLMANAAPAQAANGPDLFVTNARVHGEERYAFQGQTDDTFFTFRTRNRGDVRANRSVTEVSLRHGATDYPLGQAPTPPLAKDEAAELQHVPDIDDPPLRFNYPLGAYTMRVCADARDQVDEAVETNNCRTIQTPGSEPERFFVVRKVWKGRLSGVAQIHPQSVYETYRSGDAAFPEAAKLVFDRQINTDGLFTYDFAGPVTYKDSGSGSGCTFSGGDTQRFGPGGANPIGTITLDYLRGRYSGQVGVNGSFYTMHTQCGPFSGFDQGGPAVQPTFLNVGDPKNLPFGATRLQDGYSTQVSTWVWAFH
jgi:hypothetical protein